MKLYAQYIEEILGHQTIVYDEIGFIVYEIKGPVCRIHELYVAKEFRQQYYARYLADDVLKIAKENNCTHLKCALHTQSKDPELSKIAIISYGFKEYDQLGKYKFFERSI